MKKGIYRFYVSFNRSGSIEGIFVSYDLFIKELIESKIKIYFGEILGKHSEIYKSIEEDEIELLTEDQSFIAKFELFKLESGYNPFKYQTIGEEETIEELIEERLLEKELLLKKKEIICF